MNKKIIVIVLIAICIIAGCILNNQNTTKEEKEEKTKFSAVYKGTDVIPGMEFDEKIIKENAQISEIPSCAFNGVDMVYTYEGMEITVASIEGKNKVYEIYFINEIPTTKEGIKITDSKEQMINKYGTEFKEEFGNRFVYTKENVEITFKVENEIITGITYTLKITK